MNIVINPGSGPVEGATEAAAIANIRHFITDLKRNGVKWVRVPDLDGRGRFGFLLWISDAGQVHGHEIEMPGLPLEQVRFMGREAQDPWLYPRLYVDGSSWLWCYALGCCGFTCREDEE